MTVAAGKVVLNVSVMLISIMIKMYMQLLLYNMPNSRLEYKNHALFMTKMAKIKKDTLFKTNLVFRASAVFRVTTNIMLIC